MIRHAFLLIWQRKRANTLLIVELLVTFLVLFALAGVSLHFSRLYRQPLGFNVANTLSVRIATGAALTEADRDIFPQVLRVVQQMEAVAAVEIVLDPVFSIGSSNMIATVNGQDIRLEVNAVSQGFPAAVGMRLVQGRWFGPQDDAQSEAEQTIRPILVNQAYVDAVEGEVLGTIIPNGELQQRIVGVFDTLRQHGEFVASRPFMLQRMRTDSPFTRPPTLVVVTKPGVGPEFEEQLLNTLQGAAPRWDFDADYWVALQAAHYRTFAIPLLIAGSIVVFLLTLVGFGLLGVLWQNIIRRTPEMGLRRAMGAPASAVRLQVMLEMLAVASFALVLGLVVVVQFPLSGVLQAMDWSLFFPSAAASTIALVAMCVLFALYPSYQATRKDPVEALRYE
jgi:putative ABC transport system permease protein